MSNQLSYSFAKKNNVVIQSSSLNCRILFKSGCSASALNEAIRIANSKYTLEQVSNEEFEQALSEAYSTSKTDLISFEELEISLSDAANAVPETEDLLESSDDAPIIKLINALLSEAIRERASDVHIETYEDKLVVRFRIDGKLKSILSQTKRSAPMIISRIKIMAQLDIAEKRLPQDGRVKLSIAGTQTDVRVSTLPTSYGERIVLRILNSNASTLMLSELGLDPEQEANLKELVESPNGIVLVTGPTGSGKTTSLYASLNHLNNGSRNILTVEDPVEYNLPGIGQTQVNAKTDMTFAKGLRAILRQDPDVVMVGEIRDRETADIAIQASLTGHLVLSTLHTNTGIGAVTRLKDMKVEPFLVSSSVRGLIAQRLVRRLCTHCKSETKATNHEINLMGYEGSDKPTIYLPKGCEECAGTGYKGRIGIYEVIKLDQEAQRLIHDNASEQDLLNYFGSKYSSMRKSGFNKVLSGQTSLAEILSVTVGEDDARI